MHMSYTERTQTTLSVGTTSRVTLSSACVLPGRQQLCPTCSTAGSICRGNASGNVRYAQTERKASAGEVLSAALHVVMCFHLMQDKMAHRAGIREQGHTTSRYQGTICCLATQLTCAASTTGLPFTGHFVQCRHFVYVFPNHDRLWFNVYILYSSPILVI